MLKIMIKIIIKMKDKNAMSERDIKIVFLHL